MSPILIVLRIAVIIFAVEGFIMLALPSLTPAFHAMAARSEWVLAVVDAVALVLITSPLFYLWVIRPYISARTRAESELRENESRLNEAQRIAQIGSWDLDLRNNVLTWSDEIYRIFEIDPLRFGASYEAFLNAIHPDEREMVNKAYTRSLAKRLPYEITHRLRMPDGRIKWVHERCETEFDADGEPLVSRGTVQDATDLKQAEEALRESEMRYRDLIEGSDLGIQIGSRDRNRGRIFANRACAELFGYDSTDELLALPSYQLVAAYDRDRVTGYRNTLYEGGTPVTTYEIDGVRKDGSIVPVQVFMRRILWEGEDAIQRTFINLTERKQAETALQESEERFRSAIEASAVGISLGHVNSSQRLYNKALCDMLGYSMEDLQQIKFRDIMSEETEEEHRFNRDQIVEGKIDLFQAEICYIRRDGHHVWALVNQSLIRDSDNRPHSVIAMFQDITAKRTAEEQLQQAQKMETVGQLTGGVAHDFNNILAVIQGNLELIAERVADPVIGRMAQSAIKASSRGAELTQRLLSFSRKQTLAPVVIRPDQLVAGMADLMCRTLGEIIDIEVTGDDDLWNCKADPGQLENAILNLALNARDAMPEGGKLTIETANAILDDTGVAARNEVSPAEYVKVSVSDTGTGMSGNVIDHVFEPFFTTKDMGKGSGLGLSMVHGFINQSGGYVTIDSTEGVGTTVNLYLPRTVEPCAPARQRPKGKDPLSHGERVLLVEDNPEVRALTVKMLADLGYETIEAADGKEAIEVLQKTRGIDLLFTDIGLPGGMNGVDIAKEASRRFPDIKILFTSGYADNVLARNDEIDADRQLIKKPFQKFDLARKVRVILDQPVQ